MKAGMLTRPEVYEAEAETEAKYYGAEINDFTVAAKIDNYLRQNRK